MPRRRYATEDIIGKLREAELLLSQGQSVGQVAVQSASASRPTTALPIPQDLRLAQGVRRPPGRIPGRCAGRSVSPALANATLHSSPERKNV